MWRVIMANSSTITKNDVISFERFVQIISRQISHKHTCDWSKESMQAFREIYDSKLEDLQSNMSEWAVMIGRAIYAQDLECEW